LNRAVGEHLSRDTQEQVVVELGQATPQFDVAAERLGDRREHGHETALAELGGADVEDATRQHVVELQHQRFGYAQPGCGDQPEEHNIELPPTRIRPLPARL